MPKEGFSTLDEIFDALGGTPALEAAKGYEITLGELQTALQAGSPNIDTIAALAHALNTRQASLRLEHLIVATASEKNTIAQLFDRTEEMLGKAPEFQLKEGLMKNIRERAALFRRGHE